MAIELKCGVSIVIKLEYIHNSEIQLCNVTGTRIANKKEFEQIRTKLERLEEEVDEIKTHLELDPDTNHLKLTHIIQTASSKRYFELRHLLWAYEVNYSNDDIMRGGAKWLCKVEEFNGRYRVSLDADH